MRQVKHRLDAMSKHWLLADACVFGKTQAMLNASPDIQDQKRAELAARLVDVVLAAGGPRKVAETCGVTEQAVNGWLKTGRIRKDRFPVLADLSGYALLWIMTGEAPKYPPTGEIAYPPPEAMTAPLTPLQRELLGAFAGLTPAQQADAVEQMQAKRRLNDELLRELLDRRPPDYDAKRRR